MARLGRSIAIEDFGTFTDELFRLRSWLFEHRCPVVAMEAQGYIGVRPQCLGGYVEVVLVNARDIKNVPGRKTDIGSH
jgi:hypothetical protein